MSSWLLKSVSRTYLNDGTSSWVDCSPFIVNLWDAEVVLQEFCKMDMCFRFSLNGASASACVLLYKSAWKTDQMPWRRIQATFIALTFHTSLTFVLESSAILLTFWHVKPWIIKYYYTVWTMHMVTRKLCSAECGYITSFYNA